MTANWASIFGASQHSMQNAAANQINQGGLGQAQMASRFTQTPYHPPHPIQVINMDMATDLIFAAVQKCMQEEIRKIIREELATLNKGE